MARRQLNKLTARQVDNLGTGRHNDGGGLRLEVRESGSRAWLFLYQLHGVQRAIGFGSAGKTGAVSLADARTKAEDVRRLLAAGVDPAAAGRAAAEKEAAKAITFGEFADALLKDIQSGFKGRNTVADWKRDLEVRCKPLRNKTLAEITTDDVLAILSPLWLTVNRTARETRSRIERVFDAAESKKLITDRNPAEWKRLKPLLPKSPKSKRHHKAAPYKDVPGIVRALRKKHENADTKVNLAAEFIILTAVRTSEARFMRAKEIDFKEALWTIPAERMKTEDDAEGKPHKVPLCARALAILREVMPKDLDPEAYVFAGQWSKDHKKPLGMNAVRHTLQAIYPSMTTHGCRSSFRDFAGDETHFPREVAEMALAHKVGDEVEQAYRRGTALKKRRELMDEWGRYVGGGATKAAALRA